MNNQLVKNISLISSLIVILCACSQENNSKNFPDQSLNGASAVPITHNYLQNDGKVYMYSVELTENERALGRVTNNILAIRYIGREGDNYTFENDEDPRFGFTCKEPCRVINLTYQGRLVERIENAPELVAGQVVDDARKGALALWRNDEADKSAPNTVAPTVIKKIDKSQNIITSKSISETQAQTIHKAANWSEVESISKKFEEQRAICRTGKDIDRDRACGQQVGYGEQLNDKGWCYSTDGNAPVHWYECR
ncbi:MAG: hypothetical protein NVV72_07820 [Asticcacaulis sp.]|nr:hypothetical protein [Asticcacaulis sp.]